MYTHQNKILLVEDSDVIGTTIKHTLEKNLEFGVYWAKSHEETIMLLNEHFDFFLAIVDYNLPDAPDGEAIDTVLTKQISTIIFTANFSSKVREQIWEKDVSVIDYVLKDSVHSARYLYDLVKRISQNQYIKVLIVEKLDTEHNVVKKLLKQYKFIIKETDNAKDALNIINREHNIKLILINYNLADTDGVKLTQLIREHYAKHEIAIIGLSAMEESILPIKFIKSGANDFLQRPFSAEEFYCRIVHSVENIEYIDLIETLLNTDNLTKLNNRKYFFDRAPALYEQCKKANIPIVVAMLDIDFFKKVNDTYGHDAGDKVLIFIANIFTRMVDKNSIASRFGGEEFCIFTVNVRKNVILDFYEKLREEIEKNSIQVENFEIKITVSIGLCTKPLDKLSNMIKKSDEMLYLSKDTGRNKISVF